MALSTATNSTDSTYQLTGWNPSDTTRGSIDILWSCCITIILCCWVSTFPNAPSSSDKWYHAWVDKFNLACLGCLGPGFLFIIALGQLASARRSVRAFRGLPHCPNGREWTLVHGFFADMGGFTIVSPDYSPFPVNAEQLFYLVKHGHVDFPDITKSQINALSKTDTLSRLITLWQAFWFSVSELQRFKEGLPITAFELTALSFSMTMFLTSLCWYAKPTIATSTKLHTKDARSIEDIRAMARASTHPGLSSTWYRTPLDFISPARRFYIDVHWSYYARLTTMAKIPLFSREVKARPWDRAPSGAWLIIDRALLLPAVVVILAYGASPLAAWNFYFATEGEKIVWRVCSIYHAAFCTALISYYVNVVLRKTYMPSKTAPESDAPPRSPGIQQPASVGRPALEQDRLRKPRHHVEAALASSEESPVRVKWAARETINWWLRSWRNISPDGDPDMELGLRTTVPLLLATCLYICCRLFIYVEGFVLIRQQPLGVYTTMNKFLPFLS